MTRTNAELVARRRQAVPRGVAQLCDVFPERAENAEVWDVEGRRYIDFAGGIGVLNVGHVHPAVREAVSQQMARYSHTCFQVMAYEPYVALAERLNLLAPGDFDKKTIFLTTGAEAVENAVKIARAHTQRRGVIAFGGSFHGRTLLTLAMTGKVVPYKKGFGPFPTDVYHVPYPMAFHGVTPEHSLAALEQLFKVDVAASEIAAIVIEPVMGEGGFYIAPFEFLRSLRALCDEHGIVLVADEVQCGIARTGKMFAIEHSGVVPDLITTAKSLGGGLPLSGVTGKTEIMDAPGPGGLGGTYAGNAVACAAGLAVLDIIERERLLERSMSMGEHLVRRFRAMQERFHCIGEVRNLGAMCAVEFVSDRSGSKPDSALTKRLALQAVCNGLVLLPCGIFGNVARVLVPLTASDAIVDEGLDIFETSLAEAVRGA